MTTLNPTLARLRERITAPAYLLGKLVALQSETLYPAARRVMNLTSGTMCDANTDICLEGFPSSANSFALSLLREAKPDARIASHCHSVAHVKRALSLEIPVIIIVRKPREAISSHMVRHDKSVTEASLHYATFYRYFLQDRSSQIHMCSFETLVGDPRGLIERLDDASGLGLSTDGFEDVSKRIRAHIEEWEENNETRGALLSTPEKKAKKAAIMRDLEGVWAFQLADRVYRALHRRRSQEII